MIICAAQLRSVAADIQANQAKHFRLIDLALAHRADLVVFPELSLCGYQPRLARSLARHADDPSLDGFQRTSDTNGLIIGVGMPLCFGADIQIAMVWFAPHMPRRVYAKQRLHVDEQPYFVPGDQTLLLERGEHKLAPAICYESLQPDHADNAAAMGANVYLASVAKSVGSLAMASAHYPSVARRHGMYVVMANCVGPCDGFFSAGQSAAWGLRGELLAQMSADQEGVVVLDTGLGTASVHGLG